MQNILRPGWKGLGGAKGDTEAEANPRTARIAAQKKSRLLGRTFLSGIYWLSGCSWHVVQYIHYLFHFSVADVQKRFFFLIQL